MATEKVSSIDALSKDERVLIVFALEAFKASQVRAAKSAKSEQVRAIYEADAVKTDSLIGRFR